MIIPRATRRDLDEAVRVHHLADAIRRGACARRPGSGMGRRGGGRVPVGPRYLLDLRTAGTFTRTTEASRLFAPPNSTGGFMDWLAANARRINAYADDGSVKGHVLLEGSLQQHLIAPEDFTDAAWSLIGTASRTADFARSPDDDAVSTTADRLQCPASNDGIRQLVSGLADNTTYTWVIWMRSRLGSDSIQMNMRRKDGTQSVNAKTVDGTWRRYDVSVDVLTGGATPFVSIVDPNGGADLEVWGANLTTGTFPQSYIRSATTRGADILTVPLADMGWLDTQKHRWTYYPLATDGEMPTSVVWDEGGAGDNAIVNSATAFRVVADGVTVLDAGLGGGWARYAKIVATVDPTAASLVLSGDVSGTDSDPPYTHTATGDVTIGDTATGTLPLAALFDNPVAT